MYRFRSRFVEENKDFDPSGQFRFRRVGITIDEIECVNFANRSLVIRSVDMLRLVESGVEMVNSEKCSAGAGVRTMGVREKNGFVSLALIALPHSTRKSGTRAH